MYNSMQFRPEIPVAIRSRLAPTPSGFMHQGNAFSFVVTWLLTRWQGGELYLRIDDLDAARIRPEYVSDVFETLQWLGLDYDSGPGDLVDFVEHYSQTQHIARYEAILGHLREAGLLYACDCSRTEIQASSGNGIYPGTCRHKGLDLDQPGVAWRVRVPARTFITVREMTTIFRTLMLDQVMGDFVVRRRDGLPAYQVASLAEDLHNGINLIVRGSDLLPSTAAQLFLARQLPANSFSETIFYHHPLLTDTDGHKLSKSTGTMGLRMLRQQWPLPDPLYHLFADRLGLADPDIHCAKDLLTYFRPECLYTSKAQEPFLPLT